MTHFVSFVDPLLALIATYLIHSTILLAGCWILLQITRSASHALADRAWKIAAIAGFVTTVSQTVVGNASVFNLQLARSAPIVAEPAYWQPVGPATVSLDSSRRSSKWSVRTFVRPTPEPRLLRSDPSIHHGERSSNTSRSAGPQMPTGWRIEEGKLVCVAVVILWIAIGLMRIAVQTIVMQFRIQRMPIVVSGRTRRLLDGLLKLNHIRHHIELRSSPEPTDPMALGCLRRTIVVSEDIDQALSDDEIKAVIAHELGHFIRRDVAWLWIGRMLGACFGFQPLNFVARRRWQRASEYLCDQWAVNHGSRRLDLAKCLTTLAGRRLGDPQPQLALSATGTQSALVGRVQRLVSSEELIDAWQTKPKIWLSWLIAATITTSMVTAAPAVQAADFQAENSPHAKPPHAKPPHATTDHRIPAVAVRIDEDLTLGDFEAWVRLNLEIETLISEIEWATRLADHSADSPEIVAQVQKIRDAVALLEQRRNRLFHHFMTEH